MSELAGYFTGEQVEEARSVLASVLTQMINTVRTILAYVMEIFSRFVKYAGEHPLAMVLTVANVCIWIS